MTTSFFVHQGNKIAYTRAGAGRPILFLHNGGTSKEIWTGQAGALARKHEVICLDLLGFGRSDLPAAGYTMTAYVETLSAFIDYLGFDRISVVGNCMGSAMTLLLADRRPDIFEALVLINPLTRATARHGAIGLAVPFAEHFPAMSGWVARRVRVPAPLTRFVVAAQYGPRHWLRGAIRPFPGAAVAGAGWSTRGRLYSMAELFADTTLLAEIDRLEPGPDHPPFAVIWGNANLGLSARAGRRLNRTLRPDRAEFLPGCGHLPMMENPTAVTRIIEEFIGDPPIRNNDLPRPYGRRQPVIRTASSAEFSSGVASPVRF
nr:alpha/beta hydrolase [Nocardia vulneris]